MTKIGRIIFNRSSAKIGFLYVNFFSPFEKKQVVYKKSSLKNYEEITALLSGSVVEIVGKEQDSMGEMQNKEIIASEISLTCGITSNYPIQKNKHSLEYLRNHLPFRSRTQYFSHVFQIRSKMHHWISDFFRKKGFILLDAPVITSNDCEGAGENFEISAKIKNFFGVKKPFLTVSGQLACESFAQTYGKAYTFGPIFRAELSNTTKHVSEFWMLEPEILNCNLSEISDFAFNFLKHIAKNLLEEKVALNYLSERNGKNLEKISQDLVSSTPIKIDYKEALKILVENKQHFEFKNLEFGVDFASEHEKFLTRHFNSIVIVKNFPKKLKSFYMKDNGDETVAAFDLLVPGIGELVGGSVREDNYNVLKKNMIAKNVSVANMQWYLDLRKEGYVPSAGFGLGFERMIMYLLQIENIRDTLGFPRAYKQLDF